MKFMPGDMLPTTVMEAVIGEAIKLPGAKRLVHLQFRRFVDCPICNTHIAEFRKRAREIEAAGIKEVIVFIPRRNQSARTRRMSLSWWSAIRRTPFTRTSGSKLRSA
jgi:peroxiredoxin